MYYETLRGEDRTNNACEGWHQAFHSYVGCSHPKIFKFIEALRRNERNQFYNFSQVMCGSTQPARKKKYRDYNLRLQNVVATYGKMPMLEYLKTVASNLSFAV